MQQARQQRCCGRRIGTIAIRTETCGERHSVHPEGSWFGGWGRGVAASRGRRDRNTRMTCIAFELLAHQESPMRREVELSAINARRSRGLVRVGLPPAPVFARSIKLTWL
jgi:hypothetical protein